VVEAEDEHLPELDGEATDTGIDVGLSPSAVLRSRKITSVKLRSYSPQFSWSGRCLAG